MSHFQGLSRRLKRTLTIADAVDWFRNNDPSYDLDDAIFSLLASVANMSLPRGSLSLSREEKNAVIDQAIEWLRNNDMVPENVDVFSFAAVSHVAVLAISPTKQIVDSIGWLGEKRVKFVQQKNKK
jgi:hypothetical protein